MLLLWQLLIEMLGLFYEPTWLLDGVSRFLHGEFSLFWGKQSKSPRSFNWQSHKKICTYIYEEFAIFVFEAYYTNVWVEFDDFFGNSERKTKPIHIPIAKKSHRLERAQYKILDHVTSHHSFKWRDQIEILFKYSPARAIPTYSSRAKKTI